MLVSVVIRTLNEEKYLEELLQSISIQIRDNYDVEVVIIDSGSEDNTINIAEKYKCKVTYIDKKVFTFGKSLNDGSLFANGDILVYISGHCIPTNSNWLTKLINPITNNLADYTYGSQIGRDTTKFSEKKIFQKYFPDTSKIPQDDFFCNNANAALCKKAWEKYLFNERITGLEDMELAKRLFDDGGKIAYVSDAKVFHIHDENWNQTRRRYEREALALQSIMPEVHISVFDMIRYTCVSIYSDLKDALKEKVFFKELVSIVKFRVAQYSGSFRGNRNNKNISNKRKENYFYPTKSKSD